MVKERDVSDMQNHVYPLYVMQKFYKTIFHECLLVEDFHNLFSQGLLQTSQISHFIRNFQQVFGDIAQFSQSLRPDEFC